MHNDYCTHAKQVAISGHGYRASHYKCEQCIADDPTASKAKGSWMHLNECQTCGAVLCCDSSPNQHSRKHAQQHAQDFPMSGTHQVFRRAEPDENWSYCFADDKFYEPHVDATKRAIGSRHAAADVPTLDKWSDDTDSPDVAQW